MNDLLNTFNGDPFELDAQIVVDGPPAAALLSSTDDTCDTKKPGDC